MGFWKWRSNRMRRKRVHSVSLSVLRGLSDHPSSNVIPESLFPPRVAEHVVAAALPVAWAVEVEELDAANPFGALPGVELRDHAADRAAVIGRNRLAVVQVRQQGVLRQKID